jgi:hypothetical protein
LFPSRPAPQSHPPPFHSTFTTFSTALEHHPRQRTELQDYQHQAQLGKMPSQLHSPQDRAQEIAMTDQRAIEDSFAQINLTTVQQTTMHHSKPTKTSATGWLQHRSPQPNLPLPRELRDQ